MTTIAERMFDGDDLDGREVGIEIEVEGFNLPQNPPMGWRAEYDGSLHGESMEYVFKNPVPRGKVGTMLDRLTDKFKEMDTGVRDTGRAGVHVHINIRDLTRNELYNFITLYLIFEDILVKYRGDLREGNLFCLRTRDAEGILDYLRDSITYKDLYHLDTDQIRYASINCKAICQYGSLEFRAMRSTVDMDVLNNWVKILLSLKDASKLYKNPIDIVSNMSLTGYTGFIQSVFGELLSSLPLDEGWELSVLEGVRRAQNIAYQSKWKD